MNKTILTFFIIACAFFAEAQDYTSVEALNNLSLHIAYQNPSIWNIRIKGVAESEEVLSENVLPDPVVEFENLWGSPGTKLTAKVSQEFQLPRVFSARKDLSDSYIKAAQNRVWYQLYETALEVKLTLIDIIHVRRCVSRLNKLMENLDSLELYADRAVAGGEMTIIDKRKVTIEKVGVRQKIADYESQLPALFGRLATLSNGDDYASKLDGMVAYPDEPMAALDEYLEASSNDYRFLNTAMDFMVLDSKWNLARAERLPTISLGYVFNREEGYNYNGVNLSVSLPIYRNRHRKEAIDASHAETLFTADALSIEIKSELRALYSEATTLRAQIEELSPLVNDNETMMVLHRAYEKRVITMLDFITNINYFADAELMLYDTEYKYACAMAKLNRYDLVKTIDESYRRDLERSVD